ncbi:monooxygenase [Penicillium angulare]|uniref:monooxygenase n=1 Tax=Penicillium angulare TaxID=116970 RepID=UPI00254102E7|nr:monooxygenase [Penicillium angulare]KAJ5261235.1 monooxygenase [Penicillium angulare]
MSQLRPCKVIISGGGLAGLVLALTLEKAGVDYQLLEAYPDIIPKVGCGICILVNALTILDQLGCYDDLAARSTALSTIDTRSSDGESLATSKNWETILPERYGYPFLWMERSTILQVMYEHIVDKSKILTGKRVQSVENTEDGVEVTTTDGSVYHGDIIVGADGINSGVRREIQRHATERSLGPEYTEQNVVSATYGCMYGMSPGLPGLPEACLDFRVNKRSSSLIGTGVEDRTFWFLYKHLGRTFTGADIPRFNGEDSLKVAKEHWDETISPGIKLSNLYESKKDVLFSAMPEFVFSKWHLDRMIILGDAAHQMSSITAQGGGQAMESVACLANNIIPALSDNSKTGKLSADEINAIFDRTQEIRLPQARKIVASAHQRQLMDTMETPELEDLMLNKFPKIMANILVQRWDDAFADAISFDIFPAPVRLQTARDKRATESDTPRL